MNETTAHELAREISRQMPGALLDGLYYIKACDWAGGMWGVEIETPHVTADGRTAIKLYLGSDDEGNAIAVWGDDIRGHYTDDENLTYTEFGDYETHSVSRCVVDMLRHFATGVRPAYLDEAQKAMVE